MATLLYNMAEGALSIAAGIEAGSLTLLAFGSDSYIEVLAAGAVLWRLSFRDEEAGEAAEAKAIRIIGLTFVLLAVAIVLQSLSALVSGDGAAESLFGIGILALSLALMPVLALAKLSLAARVGMPVLAAEARETVACSYLSLTALAGLLAVAVLGWWWLDSFAAMLMVPWLLKEGLEGLREEDGSEGGAPCFCRRCLYGLRRCFAPCCSPGLLRPA